jgi:hypothetical protein
MFEISGLITPPWGLPTSVGCHSPSTITPPLFLNTGKKQPNQMQHASVSDATFHRSKDQDMIQIVERPHLLMPCSITRKGLRTLLT